MHNKAAQVLLPHHHDPTDARQRCRKGAIYPIKPGQDGSPKHPARPEGVEHAAQIGVQIVIGVIVARIGRQCRGFNRDVGQPRQTQQLRQVVECCVVLRPQQRQMVNDELELRMTLGNGVDLRQQARRRNHDREPCALGLFPRPALGIIEQCPRLRRVRRDPEPEHARLIAPAAERAWHRRRPAHHRETVGMEARRFQRQIVAIALPGGRRDHHPRHPGRIHLLQEIVFRERLRPMG